MRSTRVQTKLALRGLGLAFCLATATGQSADLIPAGQHFRQEVADSFRPTNGLPPGPVQLLDCSPGGMTWAFKGGRWYVFDQDHWLLKGGPVKEDDFVFYDDAEQEVTIQIPWRKVRQILRAPPKCFIICPDEIFQIEDRKQASLGWNEKQGINQAALGPEGVLYVASGTGLYRWQSAKWERTEILDDAGRDWDAGRVLGVGFDSLGRLWAATKAGVCCREEKGWRFYEGKDGLPWNDFTGVVAGLEGEMWFTTHLGVIRFDGAGWHYRQGPKWLPNDDVTAMAIDSRGKAWFATVAGIGSLTRRPITLAEKANFYEEEIEHYIKRTPLGFVAEAGLRQPPNKQSASPHDSDNDGLWTAMYGAGECFAYAATKDPQARTRAKSAFEALRFLQKVTQGCEHAPPKGYVARTIRPSDWPDPNVGRLERDQAEQQRDKLWKAYEPRWPKSADGKWFWKSDTSSDELDGHFFFYPLYYDLCADSEEERDRVREVVRDLTDDLIGHDFCLIDFDGKPTRWGAYGPRYLNEDPNWWAERGLKSLSILCYLSVAEHLTGDRKYEAAARELIERHGYAHNAMHPKVQHGPGSGNQSDDEMAFMCYYGLLRCSQDDTLKALIRYSFFRYWVNEAPEMNPFFNFAYAAHNLDASVSSVWGTVSLKPWQGWLDDSMATLRGFSLDRLNWPLRNSHRLDVVDLDAVHSSDLDSPDRPRSRGRRVNGKVLPVENRHFNHWNTDPWQLDYGGNGGELAAGTVFLLPYYMGLYHGFIEKPKN